MGKETEITLSLREIKFQEDRAVVEVRVSQPDGIYRELVEVVTAAPQDRRVDPIVSAAYLSLRERLRHLAELADKGWKGQL